MTWYKNSGTDSDVVLSTRVRLARNLSEYPFPSRLAASDRQKLCEKLHDIYKDEPLKYIKMSELTSYQAVSLAEKHLVSPEFASDSTGRTLLLSEQEDVSIMICEEDHVRIQAILPGLSLDEAMQLAAHYDDVLCKNADIAYSDRLGYLTECPTNLGTGMRASVMLHLPALSRSSAIRQLASTVSKLGLTLRGTYGEGSDAVGEIYQLSNTVTLGIDEKSAISNLTSITEQIIERERKARQALLSQDSYMDKVLRAYGVLLSAHMISSEEFFSLASLVRMGIAAGIIDLKLEKLTALMIELQPATINADLGQQHTSAQRDVIRAKKIKESLS